MPFKKFRSFEEARQALWWDKNDPRLGERIAALWAFCDKLTGELPVQRGVQKFRTIEEANAAREAWEKVRVQELRRRRAEAAGQDLSPSAS